MNKLSPIAGLLFLAGVSAHVHAAPAPTAQQQCLALKNSQIADTSITKAEWSDGEIAADKMSSFTGGSTTALQAKPHCVVEGEIGARWRGRQTLRHAFSIAPARKMKPAFSVSGRRRTSLQ